MRLALGLQYDSSVFHGWQTQAGRHTVQDTVEMALAQLAGAPVPTVCAGRTDAGVHATWQVVHIDPPVARPLSAWVRGVNAHLPDEVAVRGRQFRAQQAPGRPVWIAASTHHGEEEIVVAAHRELLARHPGALVVLVGVYFIIQGFRY